MIDWFSVNDGCFRLVVIIVAILDWFSDNSGYIRLV